jgi:hypothetical protein
MVLSSAYLHAKLTKEKDIATPLSGLIGPGNISGDCGFLQAYVLRIR